MNGSAQSIIIMVVLLGVMYFMLIRPQNKKDKQDKEMRSNLQVGDEIMTVGGIYGKVVRIREDRITIASGAEKTKLEINKTAVANRLTDDKAGKVVEEEKKSSTSPKSLKRLDQKEVPAQETSAAAVAEAADTAVNGEQAAQAAQTAAEE